MRDLHPQKGSPRQLKMMFWLPPEYFFASMPDGSPCDPETGEEFPGNVLYDPYTGRKLSPR